MDLKFLMNALLIVTYSLILVLALDTSEEMTSRFKSLKCIAKNKTIMEYKYSRVKMFSRTSAGLAINMTFHQPINRIDCVFRKPSEINFTKLQLFDYCLMNKII